MFFFQFFLHHVKNVPKLTSDTVLKIKDPGFVYQCIFNFTDISEYRIDFECDYGVIMFNYLKNVRFEYKINDNGDEYQNLEPQSNGTAFYFGAHKGSLLMIMSNQSIVSIKLTAMPEKCSYMKITNVPSGIWVGTPPINVLKCCALLPPNIEDRWNLYLVIDPYGTGKLDLTSNSFSTNGKIDIWYGSSIIKFKGRDRFKLFSLSWSVPVPNNLTLTYDHFFTKITTSMKEPQFLRNETWSDIDTDGKNPWPLWKTILVVLGGVLVILGLIIYAIIRFVKKRKLQVQNSQAENAVIDLNSLSVPPSDPNIPIVSLVHPTSPKKNDHENEGIPIETAPTNL